MDRRQFYVKSGLTNGIVIVSGWKIMKALKGMSGIEKRDRERRGEKPWDGNEKREKKRAPGAR